jgi:ABC-type uncharacterized transport system substrate-binding protein
VTRMRYTVLAALVLFILPAAADAERPPAPRRIRLLFWHRSEIDAIAARGLLRGLRIAGLAGDVKEFHADFDPDVATDEKGREKERRRALDAARGRLRKWKKEGDVHLLVAMGTRAALIAAEEYDEIPIVFTAVTNPAATGLTTRSRFGPTGRNVTGNSSWISLDYVLNVFRRAVPTMRRLAVIASPDNAVSRAEIERAKIFLKLDDPPLELVVRHASTPEELGKAAADLPENVDALWIPIDDLCYRNVPLIRAALGSRTIPILSSSRQAVRNGALVGLTCDYELLGLAAAEIVRKVLVDRKDPGTIPIGRLRTHELLVNLDAAGLTLPPEIVASADRILPEKEER